MRYAGMFLAAAALFLIAAGAPPDAPGKAPEKNKPVKSRDRFGEIKPLERQALTIESRGKYASAIKIYWECFADSVEAAQGLNGVEKDFEIAMQEFFLEKAVALAEDLDNRPMSVKKLEEAAVMPGVDPYVRGRVLHELMLALGAAGDMKRVGAVRDQLGIITKWAIVGPFDNERGRGFIFEYGPEKDISIERKEGNAAHAVWYNGKVRKVAWRMVPVEDQFGVVDLDVLLRPNDQVLAYALAFVHSDREQDAAVRIASDEGCIVWVNGQEAIKRNLERKIEFDQDSAPVRLARGWNSILVKVAEQEGSWEFVLRLTKPDGSPLPGITHAQTLKQISDLASKPMPETEKPDFEVAKGAVEIIDRLLKVYGNSPWLYFRKGYLLEDRHPYDIHDRTDGDCMRKACDLDPTVADFWYYLGYTETRYVKEESEREWNPRRIAFEKVVELDSGYTEAYAALASHYYDLGFLRRSLEYARASQKVNPDYFIGIMYELRALSRMGFDMEEEIRMRDLYRSGRFHMEPGVIRSEIERRMKKRDLEGAAKLQRDLLSMNQLDPGPRLALAEIARIRARTPDKYPEAEAEILEIYGDILRLNPYALDVYRMRADFHEARDRFHEALKEFDAALRIAPEDRILLKRRGNLLWRIAVDENDDSVRKRALDAWRFALEINPNDTELKRRLAFLEEASHFEDDPRFEEDVRAMVASAPEDFGNENDPYAYIFRKRITKVTKEGYHDDAIHEVIRIQNEAGIKQFESYSADNRFVYTRGRNVRFKKFSITRADGSKGPAVRIGERAWIDLPRLEVGDILDVKYRVEDIRVGGFRLMENYFGEIFLLQTDVPILNGKLVLMLPPERKFYMNARNMPKEPDSREKSDDGGEILTWRMKDVPKIVYEPYMPSELEISRQVQVSTFRDWNNFGVWYWNLAKGKCQVDKGIREQVAGLVKDAKNKIDKVRAIYNWVVTDITYEALEVAIHGWQPYDSRTVFSRGYGDCKDKSTLLRAMLGEIGIVAYPVLISLEEVRHDEDLSLPMFSHFNHMICYLPPAEEWPKGWFLDGTAQYVPSHFIPTGDAGAKVAVIKPDGADVLVIPAHTPETNQTIQEYRITLAHDGSGTVEIKASEPGEFGAYWRNRLSQEDLRGKRIEKTYAGRFPGAKYREGEFSDLSKLDETVKFRVILKSDKLIEKTAGEIRLRNVIQPLKLSNFSSSPRREHDIVLDAPYRKQDKVIYIIPDTFRVKSLPEDTECKSAAGSYRLKHESGSGKITVTRVFDRSASRIPKDKYGEFRKFCNEVDAAERGSIVLEQIGGER